MQQPLKLNRGKATKSEVPARRDRAKATPARLITKAMRKPLRQAWPPDAERVGAILRELDKLYAEADCELIRNNPFQLLCATILSAQCTDERVNKVTPTLFAHYPTAAAMAQASQERLESIIRSTGFFRNKAKNLIGAARVIENQWGGSVPRTMTTLLALPGVARKTANVVLGTGFGVAEGVVVDTHVMRLSQRLGLTRGSSPTQIERDLVEIIPRQRWILLSHQLIWHGRRICLARKPKCDICPIATNCPSAFREA
jgi:endonuclease-3